MKLIKKALIASALIGAFGSLALAAIPQHASTTYQVTNATTCHMVDDGQGSYMYVSGPGVFVNTYDLDSGNPQHAILPQTVAIGASASAPIAYNYTSGEAGLVVGSGNAIFFNPMSTVDGNYIILDQYSGDGCNLAPYCYIVGQNGCAVGKDVKLSHQSHHVIRIAA